jgi:sirohydrochlorin cobaltochelatase
MKSKSIAAELAALDSRVNALLPSRYQHCYASVSPTSMGSAGLKYGKDGRVAWDQIWTTFCEAIFWSRSPRQRSRPILGDPARSSRRLSERSVCRRVCGP